MLPLEFGETRDAGSPTVVHVLYEPGPGGLATHVRTLALRQHRGPFRPQVVLPVGHATLVSELRAVGIPTYPLPLSRMLGLDVFLRLSALLRRLRPDILHLHGHPAGLWGRLAARLAHVSAVVYTPHVLEAGDLWRPLYWPGERWLAPLTMLTVCLGERDRRRALAHGLGPVVVIPNGVSLDGGPPVSGGDSPTREAGPLSKGESPGRPLADGRSAGDLSASRPRRAIVQVGRITPQKDPLLLLAAYWRLAPRHPDLDLVFVGDGPLRAELCARARRRRGLGERVRVTGWLDDVQPWLRDAAVVALASRWEGLPYALLEAMAMGRPVVATNVGGCGELVEHLQSGVLTPPGDAAALAAGLDLVLTQPTLAQRLGERARERVRASYSAEAMVEQTGRAYAMLLQQGRALRHGEPV